MLKDYENNFGEEEVAITKNKVLKSNTLLYESLGDKLGILREISKYHVSKKYIEEDQAELMNMTLADFKKVINTYMKETDMIYVIVGDQTTQLSEVTQFKGSATILDIYGNIIK